MPDYKDEDYLRQAYLDEGKSCRDIADECGCGSSTVRRWLLKFDIARRARGEYGRGPDKSPLSLTHVNGYEAFQTRIDYQSKQIYIHRLLAVSEYGFDSVAGQVVHHKNGVKWDNRPENIQVLSDHDHKRLHAQHRDKNEDGKFV